MDRSDRGDGVPRYLRDAKPVGMALTSSAHRRPLLPLPAPSVFCLFANSVNLDTNRLRRIKCDEARPGCVRCTSSGRICDGYAAANAPSPGFGFYQLDEQPTYMAVPAGLKPSSRERQVFTRLRTETILQVAGSFDREFWTRDVLQATQVYPAIWHGAIALAAMHEHMKAAATGDRASAADLCAFSLTQHQIAIGYIMKLKHDAPLSYAEKETLLMTTMLYTAMACLQGQRQQALKHIHAALRMVLEWRFWESPTASALPSPVRSTSTSYNTPSPSTAGAGSSPANSESTVHSRSRRSIKRSPVLGRESLLQLILFFYRQYNNIDQRFPQYLIGFFNAELERSTEPFLTVTDAYFRYLPILLNEEIPVEPELRADPTVTLKFMPAPSHLMLHHSRMAEWRQRFKYLEESQDMLDQHDLRGFRILKLHIEYEEILHGVMSERSAENWAKYRHRWPALVRDVEALLEEEAAASETKLDGNREHCPLTEPVFSFSHSPLEVLRMVGAVCRDTKVRRHVISLLRKYPRHDGVWDGQIIALQIELKMQREQEGLVQYGVEPDLHGGYGDVTLPCGCVPDLHVCMDHRVGAFHVDMLGEKVTSLRAQNGYDLDNGLPGTVCVYALR